MVTATQHYEYTVPLHCTLSFLCVRVSCHLKRVKMAYSEIYTHILFCSVVTIVITAMST